jgi:hypothetical protein
MERMNALAIWVLIGFALIALATLVLGVNEISKGVLF